LKKRTVLALALCASLGLVGCASGANTTTSAGSQTSGTTASTPKFEKKTPLKVGYSVYDLQNPYFQSYTAGIKAEAATQGIEVLVADQKSDQSKQVSGSLDLINQGISGLIITPVQPDALPATITAAHAAKIPVVIGDIGTAGDYDTYIQSNNKAGGASAAEYVVKQVGSKAGTHQVGLIELHAGSVAGEERIGGFVDELAKSPNFKIVSKLAGNDTVDGGFKAAQDMLSANPDLEVIYAANDDSAIGAQRAMETAGKSVKNGFILIGFDGSSSAQQLIEKGSMSATVAQDPYGQGQRAVKTVLALLNGEDPKFDDASARTIYFPTEIVDASNLADFRTSRAAQK